MSRDQIFRLERSAHTMQTCTVQGTQKRNLVAEIMGGGGGRGGPGEGSLLPWPVI